LNFKSGLEPEWLQIIKFDVSQNFKTTLQIDNLSQLIENGLKDAK
jgi:hypothetical protein